MSGKPKEFDLLESVKRVIDDMMSEGDVSPTYNMYILTDDQWDSNVSRTAKAVIERVREELDLSEPPTPPTPPTPVLPSFPDDDHSRHLFRGADGSKVTYLRGERDADKPWMRTVGGPKSIDWISGWMTGADFLRSYPESFPLTAVDTDGESGRI